MRSIGVILGNRDFFPDHLVTAARADVSAIFGEIGVNPILLSEDDTKLGGVETYRDAQKCAELFKRSSDSIEGIVVVLPNFGDEKGVADAIRLSGLTCPILVQAYPDELGKLGPSTRRDGFCGKISVCNNLRQYGLPFSLTTDHVVDVDSDSFRDDLRHFLSVCRVVSKMRSVRLGATRAGSKLRVILNLSPCLLRGVLRPSLPIGCFRKTPS